MFSVGLYNSDRKKYTELFRVTSESLTREYVTLLDKGCELGVILDTDGNPYCFAEGVDLENKKGPIFSERFKALDEIRNN